MGNLSKTASQVREPGAYVWIDRDGVRHIGYVTQDGRGRMAASFVSEAGNTRSVSMHPDDDSENGLFWGPIQLPI